MLFVEILGSSVVLAVAVATWRWRSNQKDPETLRVIPSSGIHRK